MEREDGVERRAGAWRVGERGFGHLALLIVRGRAVRQRTTGAATAQSRVAWRRCRRGTAFGLLARICAPDASSSAIRRSAASTIARWRRTTSACAVVRVGDPPVRRRPTVARWRPPAARWRPRPVQQLRVGVRPSRVGVPPIRVLVEVAQVLAGRRIEPAQPVPLPDVADQPDDIAPHPRAAVRQRNGRDLPVDAVVQPQT